MAHRLAQVMVERGHAVTMFSPCVRPDDAIYAHKHVPIEGSLRSFRWMAGLRKQDLSDFDILHTNGDDHVRAGLRTPARVRTLHGSCFAEALHIRGTKERLRMLALGAAEVGGSIWSEEVVAVSEHTRTIYPWVKRVIPNGVDLRRFFPGGKEPDPTILFVGTYERRKRGRLLMKAFHDEVLPAVPDARLWMVCSDAPQAPRVEVLGRLDDAALADRYRRAWLFCLPSSYEGFGVPYIEAMASGTAVVATPNPGAREVLRDGRHGAIVRDDDLGVRLKGLLMSSTERDDLSRAGVERAREFAWDYVASEYESVYAAACGRAG
ncbi:MAG: glycosyltransferase family 1 protein [Acidimicrobiales bacterium]|nr:glycosyltransferase family 1 protein [Acidimicrobiales bacterium]